MNMTQTSEDQRSDRERLYDETIAPALLEVMNQCRSAGFSLVAFVEYEPDHYGTSLAKAPAATFAVNLVHTAARSNGNVDTLLIALIKHALEHGHSSLILSQLGVPLSPERGRAN